MSGRTYWQSFEHLADSAEIREVLDKEFATYDPDVVRTLPRRNFLKYVAASMALAGVGLSGCRRYPRGYLAPYAHAPREHTPGVPEIYATSWELAGVGTGLLASSFDGRPVKIEGNPQHPAARTRSGQWGSADLFAQAQPLCLFDPERSRTVIDRGERAPVTRTVDWLRENLPARRDGSRVAVLCEATSSPTVGRMREALTQDLPGAQWYTYEPIDYAPQREALQSEDGLPMRPVYRLDRARVVLSLDDDYLGTHPNHTRYAADWSVLRATVDDETPTMSRCYTAECRFSQTGAAGDVRLPVRPSRLVAVARAVAAGVGVDGPDAPSLDDDEQRFVDAAVADLTAARGECLVAWNAGLPPAVQALAVRINDALGAVGRTLFFVPDPTVRGGTIADLTARMQAGEIDTLLILGGNPVFDAPADVPFAEALAGVGLSVHLSGYDDETSAACTIHVPRAHFLESWGDTRSWDGTLAPIQPLILPLYNGLTPAELLSLAIGRSQAGYDLVRETFADLTGGGDVEFRRVLHDGVVPDSASEFRPVTVSAGGGEAVPEADGFDVVFAPDPHVFDGRFANNGWLQEFPEALTSLTWDNAAMMNLADAEELGVRTMDQVDVTVDGRTLRVAVYVLPGQPRGVIGLTLGYGRVRAGSIGSVDDGHGGGFYTYRLRPRGSEHYGRAEVRAAPGRYLLAMTQNHHLIDDVGFAGREVRTGAKGNTALIFRETSFDRHAGHARDGGRYHPANYGGGIHAPVRLQVFNPPDRFNTPHAWGMAIDTTACTGCGACVVACQSENNIPVVGKQMVLNNREMGWLRVDRYFKSEGDSVAEKKADPNPDVAFQPLMCVHCENAPCEQVCPVAATVHDTEGLNTMVYNRCIGTRYCSNNCPYKVRRFNYLDYHVKPPRGHPGSAVWLGIPDQQQGEIDLVRRMVFNPDVTVRMRGVMEKCTYCTQRIKAATIRRGAEYRSGMRDRETVDDGDVRTACQTACPTEAIVFGDLNDAQSRVSRLHDQARSYELLGELNTRPRTRHMARLRNKPADFVPPGSHADKTQPEA